MILSRLASTRPTIASVSVSASASFSNASIAPCTYTFTCRGKNKVLRLPCRMSTASLSTSTPPPFDSQRFVRRLEEQGLSPEQADGIVTALQETIDEATQTVFSNLVTRTEQEKHAYTQKVDFAKLQSEIQLLEKQDYQLLKAENERLLTDVERLKQRLREEITRTQAGVRLDLNLEKGRIRDELTARELKIREVDSRIEGEISAIRTNMESVKFNVLQYVIGTLTGSGALLLAYLRMFK